METGRLLEPRAWCRRRACREGAGSEHFPGDGCTCHAHGQPAHAAAPAADPSAPAAAAGPPRLTILTLKASRLAAFSCRACGAKTRRMIEQPALFFRCEPCAADGRWPASDGTRAGR